jgi:hypothetical protein
MEIAYWIVAALLAVFYLYAGGKKVAQSREALEPMMAWVDQVPMPLVRTIGALELLGAAGLLLPPLTASHRPWPSRRPAGLALLQVGATALHLSRHEANQIWLNLTLLAAAALATWLATTWL